MKTIGIIGAGLMGKGIAKKLQSAGYSVAAHKRKIDENDTRVKELKDNNIKIKTDLNSIFMENEILITCLPTSEIIEDVLIGENGLYNSNDAAVKIVLDFSTARSESTKKIYTKLKEKNISLLDTPMSGGPAQAEEGALKLLVGGDEDVFESVKDLLSVVSASISFAGPSGSGHVLKLVNNFLGILDQYATSAVSNVADKMGISKERVYEIISNSGGNSNCFRRQMSTIIEGEFGLSFMLSFALKDLSYALELFQGENVRNVVLEDLVKEFRAASESGFGEKDVSTIYHYLKDKST